MSQYNREAAGELVQIGRAVEELRRTDPDVSHSSLRFLEREGLIRAMRTPGGQRLYSSADIDRVRQIKHWQRQRLSLGEIRQRLQRLDDAQDNAELAGSFLYHAVAGDRAKAMHTVLSADEAGVPLVQIFGEVFQPALFELGWRWEHGTIFVAQEKEVSEIVRDLIAELTSRHARPNPNGPAIVAACVEGERHELGLRMICGLLLHAGYSVHYLGADVAPRFLLEAVRLHRPAIVLLSAKLALNLPAVRDAVDALNSGLLDGLPTIMVGGRLAVDEPETLASLGVVPVTGERIDAVLEEVNGLLALMPDGL